MLIMSALVTWLWLFPSEHGERWQSQSRCQCSGVEGKASVDRTSSTTWHSGATLKGLRTEYVMFIESYL